MHELHTVVPVCTLANRATVKVKLPQGVEQPLSAFWDGGDHTERLESAEGNGASPYISVKHVSITLSLD
jgi:hypothetical protein